MSVQIHNWSVCQERTSVITIIGTQIGKIFGRNIYVESVDLKYHTVRSCGTSAYLVVYTDVERKEWGKLVSYVLRGIVPSHHGEPSPYHCNAELPLSVDVWLEVMEFLDGNAQSALRATCKWFHNSLPVFANRRSRNSTIDSLTLGGKTYRCPVPLYALVACISKPEAVTIIDNIMVNELNADPNFYALLLRISGRAKPSGIADIPTRYISDPDFVSVFIEYCLRSSYKANADVLADLLRYAVLLGTMGFYWLGKICGHPMFDWYHKKFRLIFTMACDIKHVMIQHMLPTGLPVLFSQCVHYAMSSHHWLAIETILSDSRYLTKSGLDDRKIDAILVSCICWLARGHRVTNGFVDRIRNNWESKLSPDSRNRIYRSIYDTSRQKYTVDSICHWDRSYSPVQSSISSISSV